MVHAKRNDVFEHAQNALIQIHHTHVQSFIRAFAFYCYNLQSTMIHLADSEGPDQTARMRRRIWVFAVHICRIHVFPWRGLFENRMSRDSAFPTRWYVRPAKTQISLCIWHPDLSLLSTWENLGVLPIHSPAETTSQLLGYAAWSGPEVIKLFSCWTQLSMKISLRINMKMPTIVGIHIY